MLPALSLFLRRAEQFTQHSRASADAARERVDALAETENRLREMWLLRAEQVQQHHRFTRTADVLTADHFRELALAGAELHEAFSRDAAAAFRAVSAPRAFAGLLRLLLLLQ